MAEEKTISKVRISLRYDSSENWGSSNPVLKAGELGIEKDSNYFKVGDGTKHWNELGYVTVPLDDYATIAYADGKYVAKVSGKTLSTNDYTNEDKARVQNAVQSNWAGKANGIATLDDNGKVEDSQIPDGLEDIVNISALPIEDDNKRTDMLYYVSTGGDDDMGNIVNGTAGHLYHWDGKEWQDICHARRADADGEGNNIASTYVKKTDADSSYVSKTGYTEYTQEEKEKLAGLNNYTLPIASTDTLGGVKVGSNLSVGEDGTISGPYVGDFITKSEVATTYITSETAASTYLPIAGGTVTGDIKFGSADNYINATDYTGLAAKATADASGNNIIATYATKTEMSNKVDRETGKGLSTNDYSDEDKAKVDNIQSQLDAKLSLSGGEVTGIVSFDAGIKTGQITGIPVVESSVADGEQNAAILATFNGSTWTIGGGVYLTGDPTEDLSPVTKQYVDRIDATKVNTEVGKGLSTNDYTNDDQNRVKNAIQVSEKDVPNGIATLDQNGKIKTTQLPDGWDDIVEVETLPTENQRNDVLYYVSVGGDQDEETITLGTASHMYRYMGQAGSGTWADISSVNTADKAVHDDAGNVISSTYAKKDYVDSTFQTISEASSQHTTLQNAIDSKVDKISGKDLSTNDFTNEYKQKLDGLNNYTLPAATADTLGGVKVGSGLTMTGDTISADVKKEDLSDFVTKTVADSTYVAKSGYVEYTQQEKEKLAGLNNYTLPEATTDTLGGVKAGSGLTASAGVLSVMPMLSLMTPNSINFKPSAETTDGWTSAGMCMITYTANTISNQPTAKGILYNIPGITGSGVIFQMWLAIPDGYIACRAADSTADISTKQFVRIGTEGIIPGGKISAI